MRKIPTLFERIFEQHNKVDILPNVTPVMEWVITGEGVATEKIDGSCCAIIDGVFYKRYDAKRGKVPSQGASIMLPVIDKKKTGVTLRLMMDEHGLTVKDIQKYLKLGSVQSVYHWLNGISLPTVDNLYALSYLFQVSVDDLLCGNRRRTFAGENQVQIKRLRAYYDKFNEIRAA